MPTTSGPRVSPTRDHESQRCAPGKALASSRLPFLTAVSQQAADEAVKYIIFLADANTLFDVALGIYDFGLVLAVAQNSQKVG